MADADNRIKVFISYARADSSDFAEELVRGLEIAGFAPFIDRHDIAAGEDWETRLNGLIQSADTVIFVVSPRAVSSERCTWEVDRANHLSKRILPVIHIEVPESEAPKSLSRLNYIFFTPGHSFTKSLQDLSLSLNTDIEWIREHTRLHELSVRWSQFGRHDALLLRGPELVIARTWLRTWASPSPPPTTEQKDFIQASENAENAVLEDQKRAAEIERRKQRRLLTLSTLVATVFLAVAIAAGVFYVQGRDTLNRFIAINGERALSDGKFSLAVRYALAGDKVSPANRPEYDDLLATALDASRGVQFILEGHEEIKVSESFNAHRLLCQSGI